MNATKAEVLNQPLTSSKGHSVGLEEYYSEAGPDYAAWSQNFNMHFGFYR